MDIYFGHRKQQTAEYEFGKRLSYEQKRANFLFSGFILGAVVFWQRDRICTTVTDVISLKGNML